MIQANELRIGNKLYYNANGQTNIGEVTQLYLSEGSVGSIDYHYPLTWGSGIKLTPELLIKCGFKRKFSQIVYPNSVDTLTLQLSKYLYIEYLNKIINLLCVYDDGLNEYETQTFLKIKHLHQLQNLFFSLTGEELVYSPESNPTLKNKP